MAKFYSGKGGSRVSSFGGSAGLKPAGGVTRGGSQSYAPSGSSWTNMSSLGPRPSPPRTASTGLFSDTFKSAPMGLMDVPRTTSYGTSQMQQQLRESGNLLFGGNYASSGLKGVTASTPIVTSRPEGTVVGSTGSRGTTYINPKTREVVAATLPPRGSNARMFGGGGGGGGMIVPQTETMEFSFGPPPAMQPLTIDYDKFKDVLLQTQMDPSKIKDLTTQYNMSGEEFQKLVAAYNPTTSQIADTISLINDPNRLNAIAEGLNRPYREAFERAMPMYEQNMGLANELANQYLRGQISSDVESAVLRNSAVQRMQTGLFGQGGLGRNIAPRDLGLTSLDLQARGANLLAQTGQLATQVLQAIMPVSGREFAVSPTAIYESMRVSPTALLNATFIPASEIFRAYTVPASQVFDTYVTQAQYNQQIANQNLLNAWQGQTLPGEYVPGKGYLQLDGTTYSQTRPSLPGSTSTRWRGIRA